MVTLGRPSGDTFGVIVKLIFNSKLWRRGRSCVPSVPLRRAGRHVAVPPIRPHASGPVAQESHA